MSSIIDFVTILTLSSIAIVAANPEAKGQENLQDLAIANNEFAFNLLRKVNDSRNAFLSPFSISQVFGMLFYGARGDTAEELRDALCYQKAKLADKMVHTSFHRYVNEVMQSGNSSDGYVLETANAIFVNQKLELHSEYRNEVQNLYEASIRNIDFANRANKSLKEINDWAKMKTHERIKKILNQLDPSINMVLLNAVYFKGKWKIPFNSTHTSEYYFYNNGVKSQRKMVPIMSMTNRFFYGNFENFKALQLLYEGEQISMLILLPEKPDGLRALEDSLTSEKLSDILENLHQTKVHVSVPKFKLQFEKDLTPNIKALGINRIFSSGTAELSGMTSSPGAFVSQVVHKAVIQIDEEGTKAAAITRMHVSRSGPHEFRVNYPFLFAILERGSKSNMVLFLGRVNVL